LISIRHRSISDRRDNKQVEVES